MSSIVCGANVERYYGENLTLTEEYRKIAETGKCPFCPGNIGNKFIGETAHWNIVLNKFPYPNSRLHVLLLPKRHIVSLEEAKAEELADMAKAIKLVGDQFPFLADGYGLGLRVKEIGGATLYHLHFHLIVPMVGDNGQMPVNFAIG